MGFFDIFRISEFKAEINRLDEENRSLRERLDSIGADNYYAVKEMTDNLSSYSEALKTEIASQEREIAVIKEQNDKLTKSVKTQTNKLDRSKELVKAVNYTIDKFYEADFSARELKFDPESIDEIEELTPSVMLKLHCMDMRDLRKAYRNNDSVSRYQLFFKQMCLSA